MTDQRPEAPRAGVPNLVFDLTYDDGTSQRVATRPIDLANTGVRLDASLGDTLADVDTLVTLAFLAAGHDRNRQPYADRDAFGAALVNVGWEVELVGPTVAAPGNGSRLSSPSPRAPHPLLGSTPNRAPL